MATILPAGKQLENIQFLSIFSCLGRNDWKPQNFELFKPELESFFKKKILKLRSQIEKEINVSYLTGTVNPKRFRSYPILVFIYS